MLYYRTHVASRMQGGMAREFMSLAYTADLLVMGRTAEALDTVVQRMKSLENTALGSSWQASQRMEVIPPSDTAMASRVEVQMAKKEQKMEAEARGGYGSYGDQRPKGKGKTKDKGKEKGGKGKDKAAKKDDKSG